MSRRSRSRWNAFASMWYDTARPCAVPHEGCRPRGVHCTRKGRRLRESGRPRHRKLRDRGIRHPHIAPAIHRSFGNPCRHAGARRQGVRRQGARWRAVQWAAPADAAHRLHPGRRSGLRRRTGTDPLIAPHTLTAQRFPRAAWLPDGPVSASGISGSTTTNARGHADASSRGRARRHSPGAVEACTPGRPRVAGRRCCGLGSPRGVRPFTLYRLAVTVPASSPGE